MKALAPIARAEIDQELCNVLPERETLMMFLTISVNVQPVIVVGNAIAVQAGTIGSYLSASLFQSLYL